MRDEPPSELVEGDQGTASLFGVVTGVLLGVASVGFVATTISLLNLSGIWSGLVIPSWVTPACLLPMVGGVFFLSCFRHDILSFVDWEFPPSGFAWNSRCVVRR